MTQPILDVGSILSSAGIVDPSDTTKRLIFDVSGITTATTRTVVMPNANDTFALLAAAQTLTNKTITDATSNINARGLWYNSGSGFISSYAAPAPVAGQVYTATSSAAASWQNTTGITWRDVWSNVTTYAINDAVSYNGSVWICISSHTNQAPPNATYWNMVVDGFHFKGAWSGATAYIVNDVVVINSTTYVCILGHTNQIPPNATYWTIMADGFHWKGAWSGATAYIINDVVVSGNASYICILGHTNQVPPNVTYWTSLMASAAGGSSGQVQYNNVGVLDGSTKLNIASDSHCLLVDTTGASPAAPVGGLKLFSRLYCGRSLMSQVGPSGNEYAFQVALSGNKISWYTALGNGTTVSVVNFGNTATGTATARNVATTNFFTQLRRVGYVSAATAGSSAGTRHAAQQFWRGNGTALGGFWYVARFGLSSASSVATQRTFVGLIASTAVLSNADPSSQLNILGFGVDAADTAWTFMHNDGTGVATKETLSGTFPPRDLSLTAYEVCIYCQPNSSTVYYSMQALNPGGVLVEGSVTTDIPSSTTLLSPQIWTNNGSTALACAIDVISQYIETNN